MPGAAVAFDQLGRAGRGARQCAHRHAALQTTRT
jgi:hypothetical protein